MFITFEGIEGSGKSTQIQRCAKFLRKQGYDVVITKEPGGTPLGHTIREWLLNPSTTFHHPYSEVLLFIADRCEHAETVIKPALKANKIVLCDRYKDSTLAYQFAGRQLDQNMITHLNNLVDLNPDITLLLDCDVSVGLQRAQDRAKLDRFEDEAIEFHKRIHAMYHQLAKAEPARFRCIDANLDSESVYEQCAKVIEQSILKHA